MAWRRAAVLPVCACALLLLASSGCGRQLTVETKMGTYNLTQVETASTFQGQAAGQGWTFLLITFGRGPTGRGMISDDVEYFSTELNQTVLGPDGKSYPRDAWKINEDDNTQVLGFKVPASQTGFKLVWPGSEPLELGK